MQYLDQPYYKKEGNIFILYKLDFATGEDGFSSSTSVASGAGMEVERFSTIEELQAKSMQLYGRKATEA